MNPTLSWSIIGGFGLIFTAWLTMPLWRPAPISDGRVSSRSHRKRHSAFALALGTSILALSLALYLELGVPQAPDVPLASRGDEITALHQQIDALQKLVAAVKADPNNVDGWLTLGGGYDELGARDLATKAFKEAATRAPDREDAVLNYALHLYSGDQAMRHEIPPSEFMPLMRHVLALDPAQPMALLFVGRDELLNGDRATGTEKLKRFEAQLPEAAPMRAVIENLLNSGGVPTIAPSNIQSNRKP